MRNTLTLLALGCSTLLAQAQTPLSQGQEMGRVLSATPVTQQVAVPQQVCSNETLYTDARPTYGAGAVLGAIAGGAAGNAIGNGGGRAAATAIGLIGGALLGDRIEGGSPGYQNVQRCTTQTRYDNQLLGYDVVYEYAGRQYRTRTQADPGPWIALTVQPAVSPGVAPGAAPDYGSTSGYYGTPMVPGTVVATQPGPAAYITPPVTAVIEYRDVWGQPYRPPHRPWR